MSTNDKTIILVTGGNAGIGFDTCAALAAASPNYHVILASRSVERGQTAQADIQSRGNLTGSLSVIQLDVTDASSISAAVERVEKDFGRLDVLINNAGIIMISGDLIEQLRGTFEANTFGPFVLTTALLPLLKKSSDPRVVHVTSSLGSIGITAEGRKTNFAMDDTVYRMSKAALNMLAVCNYTRYKEWGCKVWTYDPGFVATNLGGIDKETKKKHGAGNSEDSAKGLLAIVKGERDADVGGFVFLDGTRPW